MVHAKKGKILSCNGKVVTYVDSTQVEFNGSVYQRTVRTSECEIISNSTKCVVCTKYRTNLRAMYQLEYGYPYHIHMMTLNTVYKTAKYMESVRECVEAI